MSRGGLFYEFKPVSAKAWKQKIQVDLKGADYNENLVWNSPEGLKVKPFYHADDPIEYANINGPSFWSIGQSIYVLETNQANQKAKVLLSKGVEALYFQIPNQTIDFSDLLSGIDLSQIQVYLELQFLNSDYIQTIYDFAGKNKNQLFLNIDIIENLARTGNWYVNLEKDHEELNTILDFGKGNVLSVDTALYQNAGADMVQQLAYGLAHANEYLNHIEQTNKPSQSITFKVAMGSNYFFEIAKLRALRVLWRSLASTYGMSESCTIITAPSRRNKTLYDYNTNMLRTTTECMAAVLGGSDMVNNMPYDAIYHKDNEFAERIARNQLLLLKNESYFSTASNTSNGAYYIESLTQQLAEKALSIFKSIEKSGGFLKQLKDHTIQRKIEESARKEQADFDSGNSTLVGTNKYQNQNDKMKDTVELYPFLKTNTRKTLIKPILEKRLAETVEQKRLNDE